MFVCVCVCVSVMFNSCLFYSSVFFPVNVVYFSLYFYFRAASYVMIKTDKRFVQISNFSVDLVLDTLSHCQLYTSHKNCSVGIYCIVCRDSKNLLHIRKGVSFANLHYSQ